MATRQCVQCTVADHAACPATAPVCATDNLCHGCTAHSECASNACSLADGACIAEDKIAWVSDAGTDNSTCGSTSPCRSLTQALAKQRPFVRVHGTITESVMVNGARTVILADPDAVLTNSSNDAVLTVTGDGTSLTVYDLTISGNRMAGGGVVVPRTDGAPTLSLIHTTIANHAALGISVQAGAFTLARSAITSNDGGGVFVEGSATFVIVGNTFFHNGTFNSIMGAARINATMSPANRLDFNSFLDNTKGQARGRALSCDAGTPMFTATNNIIHNPSIVGDPVDGSCQHTYSFIQPDSAVQQAHAVTWKDPMFVDQDNGNLRLQTGSPARHAADPSADVSGVAERDIDDNPRMPPPATIGAFQLP
jgi:hypothetical protein